MATPRDKHTLSPREKRQWQAAFRAVMRDSGQPPSPEALRQLGGLIQLYALRTGANIRASDSALVARMLAQLSPSEQDALASSPDAVLSKVANILTQHADEVKRQEAIKAAGRTDPTKEHGTEGDKMPRILHKRGGEFLDRLAEQASNGKGAQGTNARTDYAALPGSTSWANPVFLQSVGLTPATAGTLVAMGYTSQAQIKAIVHDTRTLGIDRVDKDRSAVALGGLKKYDNDNYRDHLRFFNKDFAKSYDHVLDLEGRYKREADPGKRAALQKELEAARKEHTDLVTKQRGKIKDPKALPHFDETERLKRESIEQDRKLGLEATQKTDMHTRTRLSAAEQARQAEIDKAAAEKSKALPPTDRKVDVALLDDDAPAAPGQTRHAAAPQSTSTLHGTQPPTGTASVAGDKKDQKQVAVVDAAKAKPAQASAKAPSATA